MQVQQSGYTVNVTEYVFFPNTFEYVHFHSIYLKHQICVCASEIHLWSLFFTFLYISKYVCVDWKLLMWRESFTCKSQNTFANPSVCSHWYWDWSHFIPESISNQTKCYCFLMLQIDSLTMHLPHKQILQMLSEQTYPCCLKPVV